MKDGLLAFVKGDSPHKSRKREGIFEQFRIRRPDCIVFNNSGGISEWHCYGDNKKVEQEKKWVINYAKGLASIKQKKFEELAAKWKEETGGYSTSLHKSIHPLYMQMIALGPEIIPYVFRELLREPDHWFILLKTLTERNPVPSEHMGNILKMREDWLNWAKENNKL